MSFDLSPTSRPSGLAELRAAYARERAGLDRTVPSGPTPAADPSALGVALGRRHAKLLDDLLVRLFHLLRESGNPGRAAWDAVAIAGVGGYGRGAAALRSDLDVRILARDAQRASAIADALLYPLWDMGVTVGHQVVTIDDLIESAREDLPTATSLLDWRHVVGDASLSEALWQRAVSGIFAHSELPRFIERLGKEIAQRHERFGGSVYLLEPDVKNGAGGLRDLDVARWAAKARYGVGEFDALVRFGALVAREAEEIRGAAEMLWRLRNLLHAHSGRRTDRLSFDEQELCAGALGYSKTAGPAGHAGHAGDAPTRAPSPDEPAVSPEAIERMMSDYYRSARTISRALDVIVSRAMPTLTRRRRRDEDLGRGVRLFDGCITMSDPDLLRTDPAIALRLVSEAVERGVPLLPYARGAIVRAAGDPVFCAALRESPEAAERFRALVATCKETALQSGSVVRELHDLGLLLAMIPEFLPVVGRVHHDVYHVYTVDVHSVAAVDRLAALVRGELAGEFGLPCRLAAEATRPTMLFFATLLHDVGKAIGGKDHSRRGAEMARTILERLGFPPEDVDEACHLILKHLVMYLIATRRDLDDPATISEFCQEVHGREGLRDLYLLTVADLSTTSPTAMTSWKARMLDELYLAADAALRGAREDGGPLGMDDQRMARAISGTVGALEDMPAANEDERRAQRDFLARYLASMPERYLLANSPAAIAAHAELARKQQHDGSGVLVALVPSRHPEAAELCVVAPDRPGLLAAITAALAASRLEVHAAQIHSRACDDEGFDGGVIRARSSSSPPAGVRLQAVDLFWVRDRGEGVGGVARAIPKLMTDIQAVLSGQISGAELAKKRRGGALRERPTPKVPTQISIDDRASHHTVIEVLARDRPGLLFAISDALYQLGLSISVAKINTEGTRVADVFYVSEADGTKISNGKRTQEVEERLRAVIQGLDGEGSVG
ncbi:bifunctional uridylyltransferase/uridylyl-removing protein GlnD [Sorangium sp. So ce1024]|uniref:bifunctional uridylyltransferase/uridylyl-removing protein GlnD n=1 Tax=Sorangium sp. So ce1024 TaxID=3133327 RepID=UPI003F07FE17